MDWLGYDAVAMRSGEFWRPFTAWITQLNLRHWLLNQWGLIVLWLLWPARQPLKALLPYLVVWLLCSVALAVSDYDRYVGLSGLLYGWLVIGAVRTRAYPVWVQLLFLLILSGKVILENIQPSGGRDWVGELIAADVAHESHLWGLLSGWLCVVIDWLRQQVQSMRVSPD
ncbi:hypothetical protein MED297_17872 [Reinekea sp. MED297]|uniref:Peptidase S54 rhomboid domain-containing protein n=1 Tax=Reinekea blandensis MED297 TaxID=314283 RepID=A4BHD7_9GAMM|nr:hypothetical protein MED297_17872 [Reinekea sp. MED297] [Reinekea blandensis MED297]